MPVVCMYLCTYVCIYASMCVYVCACISISEHWGAGKNLLTHTITTTLLDLPACLPACLWLRASSLREKEYCAREIERERCWGQLSVRFVPHFSVLFYSPAFQVGFHGLHSTCTHTYIKRDIYTYICTHVCMFIIYVFWLDWGKRVRQRSVCFLFLEQQQ